MCVCVCVCLGMCMPVCVFIRSGCCPCLCTVCALQGVLYVDSTVQSVTQPDGDELNLSLEVSLEQHLVFYLSGNRHLKIFFILQFY